MTPWRARLNALLGVSAYAAPKGVGPELGDPEVVRVREQLGGQLGPVPRTQTRWILSDLEAARHSADTGDISQAARLARSLRGDGVLAGVLSTRTGGLVRLPKRFTGAPDIVRTLEGRDGARSVFDDMCPPSELALLAADGILLGLGVAELVPVEGRDYPVLVRLDPEFLRYRWNENRWYYLSIAGQIPITPGDSRWVIHAPGGRIAPWQHGLWPALGRAWINKEHALLHSANWESKLANPARAAVAPAGATETQRAGFLQRLIAWGVNTVFELPIGWDVKLIESNGRGYEAFGKTVDRSEREYAIAIAGQIVTTDGGAGFSNADIHKSIRADLISETADSLAYTINTQVIPPFVVDRWGIEALNRSALVGWDVTPPRDLNAEAASLAAVANAITALRAALQPYGRDIDVTEVTNRFGVPIAGDVDGDGTPDEEQGFESAEPADPELEAAA